MEMAMSGSTIRLEIWTRLRVATARVIEWAMVKQVMIFTDEEKLRVTISRPNKNSKWSYPVQICFTPIRRKSTNELRLAVAAGSALARSVWMVTESELALSNSSASTTPSARSIDMNCRCPGGSNDSHLERTTSFEKAFAGKAR